MAEQLSNTAPWRRLLAFYWAFLWRVCVVCLGFALGFYRGFRLQWST
jgi:hypothetical protein